MNVRKTARGTQRVQAPHPKNGGTRGYSPEYREQAVSQYASGVHPTLVTASQRSVRRWRNERLHAYKMNGGADPDKSMSWQHLNLVLFYRLLYPDAYLDESQSFLLEMTNQYYSTQEIARAEKYMKLTRKRAATTSHKALQVPALARMQMFLTRTFPYGRVGIPRGRLVDIDEAGKWKHKKKPDASLSLARSLPISFRINSTLVQVSTNLVRIASMESQLLECVVARKVIQREEAASGL